MLAIEAIVLGSKRIRVGDALCSISSGLFMELVRCAAVHLESSRVVGSIETLMALIVSHTDMYVYSYS